LIQKLFRLVKFGQSYAQKYAFGTGHLLP